MTEELLKAESCFVLRAEDRADMFAQVYKKLLEQGEARLSALDMQFASELDKLRLSHEERLAEIDSLQVSEAELRRRGYESLSELREIGRAHV